MEFFFEVLVGGLLAGVMYSLVAIGFVLIYKASGVFNFAQGAMVLLAGLTFVRLLEILGSRAPGRQCDDYQQQQDASHCGLLQGTALNGPMDGTDGEYGHMPFVFGDGCASLNSQRFEQC